MTALPWRDMATLRWPGAFLLLTILSGAPAHAGMFARHAITLTDIVGSPRPMTLTAPDGRTRAVARFSQSGRDGPAGRLAIFVGIDDHEVAGGPGAELLWAPDSRALAVTADDSGGDTGGFELTIFVRRTKGHRWRRIDLTRRIARQFASRMRCDEDEPPNVGAVGWTSGRRLIVAAQVPRHATCRDPGQAATYIVDVPSGAVLMEVDPRMLHRRYRAMLGTMFSSSARHRRHRRSRGA